MFDFFGLPLELRNEIYGYYSIATVSCDNHKVAVHRHKLNPRALLVSQQFATEYKRHLTLLDAIKLNVVIETSALWTCASMRNLFNKNADFLEVNFTYSEAAAKRAGLQDVLLELLSTAKIYALDLKNLKVICLRVKIMGKEMWQLEPDLLEGLNKDKRFQELKIIDGKDGMPLLGWKRGKGVITG